MIHLYVSHAYIRSLTHSFTFKVMWVGDSKEFVYRGHDVATTVANHLVSNHNAHTLMHNQVCTIVTYIISHTDVGRGVGRESFDQGLRGNTSSRSSEEKDSVFSA